MTPAKPDTSNTKQRNLIIVGAVLTIALAIFFAFQFSVPQRSTAAYCKVYKEEKSRLATLPGETWPAGIFDDKLNDAGEIDISIGRLEKVAPEEIKPDLATLKSIYKKIHDDPTQAFGASLSGISAEDSVKSWTKKHCTN